MPSPRYALVAYVRSRVGEFVENLRRELHPALPHLGAHITFLPPRPLQGTENAALQLLERVCGQVEPFVVTLGDVETFVPTTPTVYIRVAQAASRLLELHDQLNAEALAFATDVAAKNPDAIRAGKRLLDLAVEADQHAILLAETTEQVKLIGSPNQVEAVKANLEKRGPHFAD